MMTKQTRSSSTLGVLSIATNVYLKYWKALALSIDSTVRSIDTITLHVFTDQADEARAFARDLARVTVHVHEIEPLRWPEATLFRYKIFAKHREVLTEPYLLYLDADTLVTADFERDLLELMENHGVLLVEQAGSWRPSHWTRLLRFYALHPGAIFADVMKIIREGGLGTWELRPESTAFVPRSQRKEYVTGAVWMGRRDSFFDMVSELADRVDVDWAKDIVAVWHDESHLNWWSATHRPYLLDPRYYFFPGQHHLDELPSIIRIIAKDEITR